MIRRLAELSIGEAEVANHKSAAKRHRQSERRRLRNQDIRSRMRTTVKKFLTALDSGDRAAFVEGLVSIRGVGRDPRQSMQPKRPSFTQKRPDPKAEARSYFTTRHAHFGQTTSCGTNSSLPRWELEIERISQIHEVSCGL